MVTILVVEDDVRLNQSVCQFLSYSGIQAMGCLCAEEVYDAMVCQNFDLIISDVMLPRIDGFAFTETVRSSNQTIPILFMTARDDISSKQRGFHASIDDYMVKPIDLEELILRIRALLRRANIHDEKKITAGNVRMDADAMTLHIQMKNWH